MVKKRNGFTLFELLVSISIIGILVALAVVSYSSVQKKARDTRRMEDMQAIQKAAEMYYSSSNFVYPATTNAPTDWTTTTNGQVILESFPINPKGDYSYLSLGSTGYCSCALMENINLANSGIGCSFQALVDDKEYFCVKNQQ